MAVTTALLGRVDPPIQLTGNVNQPLDTTAVLVDVTLGLVGDYVATTGIDLTTAMTAAGISTVTGLNLVSIRAASGNAWKVVLGTGTLQNATLDSFTVPTVPRLRIFVNSSGTSSEANATTTFVAGDIIRLMLFGV